MLRVAGDPTTSNFLSVDKKRKQLTLQEPGNHSSLTLASSSSSEKEHQVGAEDRRVGVAAPKMFAFDGLFTAADNSQVRNCAPKDKHDAPLIIRYNDNNNSSFSIFTFQWRAGRRCRFSAEWHCHRRHQRLGRMRFLFRTRSTRWVLFHSPNADHPKAFK